MTAPCHLDEDSLTFHMNMNGKWKQEAVNLDLEEKGQSSGFDCPKRVVIFSSVIDRSKWIHSIVKIFQ